MTNTFRVGLIGLGHQGTKHMLPGILDSTTVTLTAVCDVNENLATYYGSRLSVPHFTSSEAMLDSMSLDFVVVAIPHNRYKDVLLTASKAKIHVLKEKPLALNLAEARLFHEISITSDIEIMTTLQRRFHPVYQTLNSWVSLIGRVKSIDIHHTLGLSEPNPGWRGDIVVAGGGCLLDLGYHVIDIVVWNFGLPRRVLARFVGEATPEHTATIYLEYSQNLKGRLHISRVECPKSERTTIIGEAGTIEVIDNILTLKMNAGVKSVDFSKGITRRLSLYQIDYFAKVVAGKASNFASPRNHLDHMRFLHACYLSHEKNMAVDL